LIDFAHATLAEGEESICFRDHQNIRQPARERLLMMIMIVKVMISQSGNSRPPSHGGE